MERLPIIARRNIFFFLIFFCHDIQAQRFIVLSEYTSVTDVWPDHILLSDDPKALHNVKNSDITKRLLVSKDVFDVIHSKIARFDTVLNDGDYKKALDVLYTTSELKPPISRLNTHYYLKGDPIVIHDFFDHLIIDLGKFRPIDITLIESLQRFVNSYWMINKK